MPDEGSTACAIFQRLVNLIADMSPEPKLGEYGRMIDRLTSLENASLSEGASAETTEAIRSVRLAIRVTSLMPYSPLAAVNH